MKRIICADIGGTNTTISMVEDERIVLIEHYRTEQLKDFSSILTGFMRRAREQGMDSKFASLSVAGPVMGRKVSLTNVSLEIDARQIEKDTGLEHVMLMNDFEAISFATNIIDERDMETINQGEEMEHSARCVLGAGTGLGKSYLVYDEKGYYMPFPSQGGHADLVAVDEEERSIADYISQSMGYKHPVSYEDVLSGRGLEAIYSYLAVKEGLPELSASEIAAGKDTDKLAERTLKIFTRFYARCAKNFFLDTLARGGVYIAGGIAAKNKEIFHTDFMPEFVRNNSFQNLLEKAPVRIITKYDISHIGAAFGFMKRYKINEKDDED